MKAFGLAVACVATGALLAGCAHSNTPSNKDDSAFAYLLDKPSTWVENKVDTLPPLPQDSDLLPFDVSQNTPLQFSLDAKSVSVGSDGVVRYTVVVTSPSGARNVNYEGIRCDTYEWRLYAGLNEDHNGWDRTVANDFTRIENGNLNAYHASLYQDYFCASKIPLGKAKQIVDNVRYHRTQSVLVR
ncbi:CNP1-like family protein [Paraburkholderia sp. BL10I2N1]|uniref:CNP1-like family protein n=1 Tax=Paraburkholderia sp. BL10I2N1 TaxID=1938796 RepID=UPI00105DF4CD|nr:CNP1-like family protein [Paraburkholderia sp. BL10I2N1]TDN67651.1 CNP1-like family protein [Paraburkholderia sp. BL10I2N1]